jgi:hypothetical protein
MRSSWWPAGLVTVVLAVIVANVVGGCGSGATMTITRTIQTPAPRPAGPASATVALAPTRFAAGASGTVTISLVGKSEIRLVISLTVPSYPTYGISLWSDSAHWQGLYTGARGSNTQALVLGAQTLLRYRLLEVGQEIVHGRVTDHLLRLDRKSIQYRALLQIPTGELLERLLDTAR